MDKVIHFEIPADNLERAKKFYQSIFGWQLNDMPEMNYTGVTTVPTDSRHMPKEPGAINGGMYKRTKPDELPVFYINVPSIDDYLKKVERAGGKTILSKQKVSDMGFYARLSDTEGNVIGLWEHAMKP
jgi:predicted enzyme related to lactoylglutathione lyase